MNVESKNWRERSRCVACQRAFTLWDSIWRAADDVASKIPAPGPSRKEHRRLLPLMVNSTPNVVPPRRPRGHDFELVRCGFSHRSNWMSIAAKLRVSPSRPGAFSEWLFPPSTSCFRGRYDEARRAAPACSVRARYRTKYRRHDAHLRMSRRRCGDHRTGWVSDRRQPLPPRRDGLYRALSLSRATIRGRASRRGAQPINAGWCC